MLRAGNFTKQRFQSSVGFNEFRKLNWLPDRCSLIQLARMGAVIFLAGVVIFSLLTWPFGPLPWAGRLLAATGLLVLLLPAIYLMWGRPLALYISELRQREEDVRTLSRRLLSASERERHQLALDLHDEFGQSLTALRWGMERIKGELDHRLSAEEAAHCEQLLAQVGSLGTRIRHLSASLHPVMLDNLGLVPTLQWAVDELASRHPELRVELRAQGLKRRLPPAIELVLYRISQEAMTNAVRHARPDSLTLTLTVCHPKVLVQIQDDGAGFVPPSATDSWSGGLGLFGMRERAASVGGSFSLHSAPGAGTLVRVELPVSLEESDENHPYSGCR